MSTLGKERVRHASPCRAVRDSIRYGEGRSEFQYPCREMRIASLTCPIYLSYTIGSTSLVNIRGIPEPTLRVPAIMVPSSSESTSDSWSSPPITSTTSDVETPPACTKSSDMSSYEIGRDNSHQLCNKLIMIKTCILHVMIKNLIYEICIWP